MVVADTLRHSIGRIPAAGNRPARVVPLSADSPIAQAVERFLFAVALDVKPATVVYYRNHLKPLLSLRGPIGSVALDDLRALYAGLKARRTRYETHPTRPALRDGLSVYSLHKYIRAWKRFFLWLVDEEVLIHNPARKLKRPALPKAPPKDMTSEDLERLLEAARPNARDYAVMCFLADTACRVAGLSGLTLDRLDLGSHRALVVEKGSKSREVHFEDRTEKALRRYLDGERARQIERLGRLGIRFDARRVLLGRKGALTTAGIYLLIKRLARKAGVHGRYNPHSIRHAWARHAIRNRATFEQVRAYLGHANVTTTINFYSYWDDEELHEQHGQLSFLRPEGKDGQG